MEQYHTWGVRLFPWSSLDECVRLVPDFSRAKRRKNEFNHVGETLSCFAGCSTSSFELFTPFRFRSRVNNIPAKSQHQVSLLSQSIFCSMSLKPSLSTWNVVRPFRNCPVCNQILLSFSFLSFFFSKGNDGLCVTRHAGAIIKTRDWNTY